jgi:hypothetical protein
MPINKAITFDDAGYVGYSENDSPDPSFMDTLGASLRQENTIGSTIVNPRLNYDVKKLGEIDPVYDPYKDIKGYEEYAPLFEEVYNPTAASALKQKIDMERKDRATLAQSGWTGTALSFGSSLIDLPTLLPGGALVRGGKIGYDVIKSAAAVAAASGVSVAAQEAVLQGNQVLRTPEESAIAIGGSVILGGILGGSLSKLFSKGEWTRVSKSLEDDLSGEVANPAAVVDQMVKRAQAAGAASVDDFAPTLKDMGIGGPRAAEIVSKVSAAVRLNPGIRTLLSPSTKVRETYLKMVDNPVYTTMNMEGKTVGADVENLVKIYNRGAYGQWKRLADSEYLNYRKSFGQNAITARMPATGEMMTKSQFMEAVAKAGRREDIDVNGNEFVTRTAQSARQKVFDPLLERAIAAKLLPEDVKTTTAASYVTRLWNRERLIGEEPRFRQIAREYFDGEISKIESMQKAGKDAPKIPDFISDVDRKDYIEDVITEVFNNLTGKGKGDVPEWIVPVKKGPLKERTFNIQDAKIEDFLHNDAEMILRRYSRSMAADVELTQRFGRADMKDQFEAITKDYEGLRKEAKTLEDRMKLDKAEDKDVRHLTAFRDMLRGTYQAADRSSGWTNITNAALTWNYMRLLGGVTVSSLTDAARFPAVHGMSATMKEALPILTSRINGIRSIKIAKQDAKDLGTIAEQVMQARFAAMADLRDPYRYGNRYERFLDNAANIFTKATGIGWWTDTMNSIASVMTENRVLKNVLNWQGMDKYEKAYMGYLGIDEDMAQRVAAQFQKHGVEDQGIRAANVREWDDDLAYRAFGAALNKDVDRTIVKPGMGDKPLWMKTNTGRMIMQFKTFGMASHQRVLIAGLQERPRRLAEGLVFGTAIGMMVGYLKMVERGDYEKAQNLLNNPGKWIGDGVDRTGLLFLPFEVTNTADKIGASLGATPVSIPSIMSRIAGDKDHSGSVTRYQSRDPLGAVLGPTAGIFSDLAAIAAALSKGERNKGATNAALRQIPGGALPGARTILNAVVKPAIQ